MSLLTRFCTMFGIANPRVESMVYSNCTDDVFFDAGVPTDNPLTSEAILYPSPQKPIDVGERVNAARKRWQEGNGYG
jgi:hypothetical protein